MKLTKFLQHKTTCTILMVAGVAYALSPCGSAAIALLCGVLVAIISGNPFATHTKLYAQKLLTYSIIGLGAGMNLVQVGEAGLSGLSITIISITCTLAVGIALGRLMKSESETSLLISVGTAVCGGSAIAAIAPVIKAKPQAITVALGTVFLLNALALFAFPAIGHAFNLTQPQFGLWSALAIHDTSSVVGAGLQYGADALRIGTTIKLARALWIVPLTIGFGFYFRDGSKSTTPTKKPWFILGFIMMAGLVTWVPQLQTAGHVVEMLARKCLVVTLFLIGSNLTLATLKSVGIRPLAQGVILWLLVSTSSLALIKLLT